MLIGFEAVDDFQIAKVRLKYIMNLTRSYHLWHPPASSRPDRLRNGENEEYLHRRVRLTRCMSGLKKRTLRDLEVRLCGVAADATALQRVLGIHFKWPQLPQGGRADVEVLPYPGEGRFTGIADARLLLVTQRGAHVPSRILKRADVILSPLGDIGRDGQIRLRLEDQAGLANALGWRPSANAHRRAA